MPPKNVVEDFERRPILTSDEATTKRGTFLTSYIDNLSPTEHVLAAKHAEAIYDQGGFLPSFVVITPIAAHQEQPDTILHALAEYDRQKDAGPFSIVLGLNYPSSHRDNPLIEANRQAVDLARLNFPNLDIRTIEQSYRGPTTIGRIRRDIWNSALILAERHNSEVSYREVFGLNQDIDLVTLSPHFIQASKEHLRFDIARYNSIPELWAEGFIGPTPTKSKHAYDKRFPNTSKAVLWREFTSRHQRERFFEAGVIIPFLYYARNGGISGRSRVGEVISLIAKNGSITADNIASRGLHNVYAETSIRRYAARLPDNDFDSIWTPSSFSQADRYRENEEELVDISHDRLEQLIVLDWQNAKDALLNNVYRSIQWGPYEESGVEKVRDLANRELLVAQKVLERVIGLPDFAKVVEAERSVQARILGSIYAQEVDYGSNSAPPDPSMRSPR